MVILRASENEQFGRGNILAHHAPFPRDLDRRVRCFGAGHHGCDFVVAELLAERLCQQWPLAVVDSDVGLKGSHVNVSAAGKTGLIRGYPPLEMDSTTALVMVGLQ